MSKRPNVILMMADDLGIGDLSCFNPDSKINTAHIDALASDGIRFTDMHATSALCTPSRYGILTGRYNWRSRLKRRVAGGFTRHIIEEGRATLGTLFKKAGYQTAVVGKWHVGLDWYVNGDLSKLEPEYHDHSYRPDVDYSKPVKNGPDSFGFDYSYITPGSLDIAPYVFIENGYATLPPTYNSGSLKKGVRGVIKDTADKRISDWPNGPTSVSYNHMMVVPDSADRVIGLIQEYANKDNPFFIYYPTHAPHVPCIPTPEYAGRSGLGAYGDMILMIDDIVGRISDTLKEQGIEDDTIFIFTSDNGSEHSYPELGHESSYIYRGHKSEIWDGGHRIPFVVRWPEGIDGGISSAQVCSLADMYATFADILEISVDDDQAEDSISNLPIWKGNDEPVRDYTVSSSGRGYFCIRKGKWKLEMCSWSGGFDESDAPKDLPPVQLYDMENDVSETTNVYDQFPEVVDELKQILTQCVISGRSTPGMPQKNTGPEWWPELCWIDK